MLTYIFSHYTRTKIIASLLTANSCTGKNFLSSCWQLISRTVQKFIVSLLTANLSHCKKIYYLFVDFWFLPLFKTFYDLFADCCYLALYTNLLSFCWQLISRTVEKSIIYLLTSDLSHCSKILWSLCRQLISRTLQKCIVSLLTVDLSHCTQIYYLFVGTVKHAFYVLTIFTVPYCKKLFSLCLQLTNDSFLPWKKASFFLRCKIFPDAKKWNSSWRKEKWNSADSLLSTLFICYLLAMQRGKCTHYTASSSENLGTNPANFFSESLCFCL